MMKGKCNCGKKATSEYLIRDKGVAWTVKFCKDCAPKLKHKGVEKIYGK